MNRGRYQQDAHAAKKVRKALRAKAVPSSEPSHITSRKASVKGSRKDKSLLSSLHHQMLVKKSRSHSRHSKRTTPGEITEKLFSPSIDHQESTRWLKTIVKQSVYHAKRLGRKIRKAFR